MSDCEITTTEPTSPPSTPPTTEPPTTISEDDVARVVISYWNTVLNGICSFVQRTGDEREN